MKKFVLAGAIFGLLLIPLSTLGLVLFAAEVLFMPFVLGPRWALSLLMDISAGGPLMAWLMAISVLWYALLGALLGLLFKKGGKWSVVGALVLYYLLFAVFGISVTRTVQRDVPQGEAGGIITTFEECARAGNPVMESYPRQCRSEFGLFIEGDEPMRVECDGSEDVCVQQIECSDGFVTEDVEVCGKVHIVCITTPCDPVEETFKNRCEAREREAFDIKMGSCEFWNEADTFIQAKGPVTWSIAYPKTWFQHGEGRSIIFTKDTVLAETPSTEGYALGPQFTINLHDVSDNDLQSYDEWLDLYGMTEANELFVSGMNQNVNGYQMRRVVTRAAGADGLVLHYVFFVDIQRILVFSHYPYHAETTDTQDFERVMRTFSILDYEREIISN